MVTWFAGLFYLPRLFVYQAVRDDGVSNEVPVVFLLSIVVLAVVKPL